MMELLSEIFLTALFQNFGEFLSAYGKELFFLIIYLLIRLTFPITPILIPHRNARLPGSYLST